MHVLVTGGAGFIGSNVIRHIIDAPEIERLVNLDCLTYAGHLENVAAVARHPKYVFEKVDLREKLAVFDVLKRHRITHVIHLAAESHVDRSIMDPHDFIHTNVIGTFHLLEACRELWSSSPLRLDRGEGKGEVSNSTAFRTAGPSATLSALGRGAGGEVATSPNALTSDLRPSPLWGEGGLEPDEVRRSDVIPAPGEVSSAPAPCSSLPAPRFLHVSTDEVYGSLGPTGSFTETSPYAPNSPYSASKAASDMFVRAYHRTYGLPVVTTNCSNNYGPYQFPEKLIPVVIQSVVGRKPIPVYGDGMQVRDWLDVRDHAEALWLVLCKGRDGETYNIGANNELPNLGLVEKICDLIDEMRPELGGNSRQLITFVADRPGHDRRYAMDASKLQRELGWKPKHSFETGLRETVRWYLENQQWCRAITNVTAQLQPSV